jgi:hypothetical protein
MKNLIKLNDLSVSSAIVVHNAALIKIESQDDIAIANKAKKSIIAQLKLVEDTKVLIKKEYLEICQIIDARARELKQPLQDAKEELAKKFLAYEEILEEQRRARHSLYTDKLGEINNLSDIIHISLDL